MGEKFGRKCKYMVIKWADISKYTAEDFDHLYRIIQKVEDGRTLEHKNPSPNYVVVNQDEPYAEKVWSLIKEEWERTHPEAEGHKGEGA